MSRPGACRWPHWLASRAVPGPRSETPGLTQRRPLPGSSATPLPGRAGIGGAGQPQVRGCGERRWRRGRGTEGSAALEGLNAGGGGLLVAGGGGSQPRRPPAPPLPPPPPPPPRPRRHRRGRSGVRAAAAAAAAAGPTVSAGRRGRAGAGRECGTAGGSGRPPGQGPAGAERPGGKPTSCAWAPPGVARPRVPPPVTLRGVGVKTRGGGGSERRGAVCGRRAMRGGPTVWVCVYVSVCTRVWGLLGALARRARP